MNKIYVKHLNFKFHYQQLRLKYLCNLARYWLRAPWGWHHSVETCRSVIIYEIIVHLLVILQNDKRRTVQVRKYFGSFHLISLIWGTKCLLCLQLTFWYDLDYRRLNERERKINLSPRGGMSPTATRFVWLPYLLYNKCFSC